MPLLAPKCYYSTPPKHQPHNFFKNLLKGPIYGEKKNHELKITRVQDRSNEKIQLAFQKSGSKYKRNLKRGIFKVEYS